MAAGAGVATYGVSLIYLPAAWIVGGVALGLFGYYGIDDGESPPPLTPLELARRVPGRLS